MRDDRISFHAAWWSACALAGVSVLGCNGQSYAGLANVQNPNRPWSADDQGRDAVANGPESCGPASRPGGDPLPVRVPPCPEQAPRTEFKPRPRPNSAGVLSTPAPTPRH